MKIKFDVELTPKEARELMGLPDLEPVQKELMTVLEARLKKNVELMDPEKLMKNWFSGWQNMQNIWGGVVEASRERSKASAASRTKRKRKSKSKPTS